MGVKRITACADPYAFPSTEITDVARGFDVDILKAIAKEQGWETFFIWVNTSGRGGVALIGGTLVPLLSKLFG